MAAVVNCHFCNEIHFSNPRPYTEYDNDKIAFEYIDYSTNDITKSEIERFIKIQRCIANKLLTEAQNKVNDVEPFVKDSHLYIYEYFSGLRNKADLAREQLVQLIDQLKEMEIECKKNAEQIAFSMKEKLDKAKTDLEAFKETIKTPILDCDEAKKLTDKIEAEFNNTDYLITRFKNDLLQNKQCSIISHLDDISSLETNDDLIELQIIDSNETDEEIIEFSMDYINPVKSYNRYVEYFESKEWTVAKGFYWKICNAKVEHDSDYYLAFELLVKYENEETLKELDQVFIFILDYLAVDMDDNELISNILPLPATLVERGLPTSRHVRTLLMKKEDHGMASVTMEKIKIMLKIHLKYP